MKQVKVRSNFFEADIRLSNKKATGFIRAVVKHYRSMCPTSVVNNRNNIKIFTVGECCFLKVEIKQIDK